MFLEVNARLAVTNTKPYRVQCLKSSLFSSKYVE